MENESNNENDKVEIRVNRHIARLICINILFIFLLILSINFGWISKIKTAYINKSLSVEDLTIESKMINISLKSTLIKKDRWCQIIKEGEIPKNENWVKVSDNNCILNFENDSKYIVIKDDKYSSEKIPISDYINSILSLNFTKERIILVQDETKPIDIEITSIGNPDKTFTVISENEEILGIQGNNITGKTPGSTNLIIYDKYNHVIKAQVIVTDLITTPQINEKKEFLPAGKYTEEEAHLLDEILEERVNEAGLKTRAGVVAAARFITLEFKYRIPYFLENGRFQETGFSRSIDGEGRYYHKGLYLSKDKFKIIKKSRTKPAIWGEVLYEASNEKNRKNGLDCSGFVTWALYNGGYDPGDIGAGPGEWYLTLPDLGKSQDVSLNLLKSGNVRAGDLVGWNGHIGIIIGIDENYIYTADTVYYSKGLVAAKYTYEDFVRKSGFTHIYDMTEYYIHDGNYTNMF